MIVYPFSVILVFSITSHASQPSPECVSWFKSEKIKPGIKDCELKCATTKVDMGTFHCPNQCDDLCKMSTGSNGAGDFIYYPGLTPTEEELVKKNPKEALIVFLQKTRAEFSSARNFPKQTFNDEGDAFRHYIWAGLITKELGPERAQAYLDAHEDNPAQPADEKAMDLANNRGGILSAQKLIKDGTFSINKLEKAALDDLRLKKLVVLNPGQKIPENPE